MADDDDDPTLEKSEGAKIEWKPSKNVTVKLMRKKQKAKRGGGQRTIEKEEPCDSFFNFFSPPALPGDDVELDEEEEENLHSLLEECTP
jgi:nucleosome assembly protein 1-like 1